MTVSAFTYVRMRRSIDVEIERQQWRLKSIFVDALSVALSSSSDLKLGRESWDSPLWDVRCKFSTMPEQPTRPSARTRKFQRQALRQVDAPSLEPARLAGECASLPPKPEAARASDLRTLCYAVIYLTQLLSFLSTRQSQRW